MTEIPPEDLPGEWFDEGEEYDFQIARWRNGETGYAIVVESREEPWHSDDDPPDYSAHFLEPGGSPDPVTTIVASTSDKEHAVKKCVEFMEAAEG